MNKLSKVVTSVAVASVLASIAVAEESGVFLGAEVGYGDAEYKIKVTIPNVSNTTTAYDGGGVKYGFIMGYKQFFTPYIGLRYYANINALHSSIKTQGTTFETTKLNYGANVDLLGNFIAKESIDFGGFVGIGLGGNSYLGADIDDLEAVVKQAGTEFTKTSFDVALNVGLRANIAHNHGIEIAARVPFLPTTLVKLSQQGASSETTLTSRYSITARYTFSF